MASPCWGRLAGACHGEEEEEEEELGNVRQGEAVQREQASHRRGRGRGRLAGSVQLLKQGRQTPSPAVPVPVTAHNGEAQPAPEFARLCLQVCNLDGNPWQPLPSGTRVLLGARGGRTTAMQQWQILVV